MKYCEGCGRKVASSDKYCSKCGKSLIVVGVAKANNESLGTASMVLGIISLVLSFIINLLVFPLALSGFVMGIANKAQKGKKVSGIILNALAMFMAIMVFVTWIFVITFGLIAYYEDKDPIPNHNDQDNVWGTWNCKEISSIGADKYDLTVKLINDDTFTVSKYDNQKDYIEGTYTFNNESINKITKSHKIYSLELKGEKEYKNNDFKEDIDKEYEMVITKTKKDYYAVFNVSDIDKPYYCTK